MSSNGGMIYIVRGLPGSGKSTFSRNLAGKLSLESIGTPRIFENDEFFVDEATGEYRFDRSLSPTAVNWTVARVYKFCRDFPNSPAIVSNTFTTNLEMHPYYNIAYCFGRDVAEVNIMTSHGSIHNVPDEVIEKMRDRWEYGNPTIQYFVYEDSEADDVCEHIVEDFNKRRKAIKKRKGK